MTHENSYSYRLHRIATSILVGIALNPICYAMSSSEPPTPARQTPVFFPTPATARASSLYTVFVDGIPVLTEKYKDINYAHFLFSDRADITVTFHEDIRSSTLSPEKYDIPTRVEGRMLSFSLDKPRKLVIRINNVERLFVFADSPGASLSDTQSVKVSNLLSSGVDHTGRTIETERIQKAIDDLPAGGVLFLPPGTYQTGTLHLKSDITLFLAGGAVLKGAPSYEHYPSDRIGRRLLMIADCNNVAIKGHGVIDGNGAAVRASGEKAHLITMKNSTNILVEDVFLRESGSWNTHILHCTDVTVRNVKMINDVSLSNTDGFDPDSSCNVLIEDCFIYAGDDAFAIKTSNRGGFLRDLTNNVIRDNVVLTQKSALKIGTETRADRMSNITFLNNHVIQSDRGMAIYCNDGADISNVHFVGNSFEANYPDSRQRMIDFKISSRGGTGQIRDVLVKDCSFKEPFPRHSTIDGFDPEHAVRNIQFENFSVGAVHCSNPEAANLDIGKNVKGIIFRVTK